MGRRRWGLLLAVVVGGDDDLRSRLASRAAAIRAARGEKGAPSPPVVLRPPAPRVDHSDAGEGDAVAGAAISNIAVVDARRPEHDRWRGCSFFAARRADGGSPAREAGAQVVVAAHDDGEEDAPAAAPHFASLRSRKANRER